MLTEIHANYEISESLTDGASEIFLGLLWSSMTYTLCGAKQEQVYFVSEMSD